jgi:hypothetical protein
VLAAFSAFAKSIAAARSGPRAAGRFEPSGITVRAADISGAFLTIEKKRYRYLALFADIMQPRNGESPLSSHRVANLIQSPSRHRVLNI